MERLTQEDFESHFCLECQFHGEPNGCNRPDGICDAYWWCFAMWEKLATYEKAEEKNEMSKEDKPEVVRCVECRHGKPHTVVGDGINEPPYIEKIKCETGLGMRPWDFCSYGEKEG